MSSIDQYKTITLVDNKPEEIIARKYSITEIPGYSSAFCKCGFTLSIKEPDNKGFHTIKCPECGKEIQLFCGRDKKSYYISSNDWQ